MNVSIIITTRNRANIIRNTCSVLSKLNPPPYEIIITADGCDDNTIDIVREELPLAKVIINSKGMGSVASRDRMIREARGDLILAIDDDSYPENSGILAGLGKPFEENPKLAVMGLPQRTDEYPETLTMTDFGPARPIRSFTSSGAVLRRATYLTLPGFESMFVHMYEEPDYSLQCVGAGHEVMFIPGPVIRHHWTGSGRSELRNHQRHGRNEFWSTLMRCPMPYLLPVLLFRAWRQLCYAWSRGMTWVIREPFWWVAAARGIPEALRRRHPVTWPRYRQWLGYR
jgi:GT2 family glycosyltransferase